MKTLAPTVCILLLSPPTAPATGSPERSDGCWIGVTRFEPADAEDGDRFASSAAVSGSTLVVGAPGKSLSAPTQGAAYVFVDSGAGCANRVFASGAKLEVTGVPSVTVDTLVLRVAGQEPSNSGLYFQGTTDLSPGLDWGDGLRCTGGAIRRLQVRFADGAGASTTTIPIGVAGGVSAGDTRYYQLWYRTVVAPPCGAGVNDFNASNGVAVRWYP